MKSKIKAITVVNQQGSHSYNVGCEYRGLILDRIEDHSVEFPESLTVIYRGLTADNQYVFEAINVPIDVEFGIE